MLNLIKHIKYQYSNLQITKLDKLKPNLITIKHTITKEHKVYEIMI